MWRQDLAPATIEEGAITMYCQERGEGEGWGALLGEGRGARGGEGSGGGLARKREVAGERVGEKIGERCWHGEKRGRNEGAGGLPNPKSSYI